MPNLHSIKVASLNSSSNNNNSGGPGNDENFEIAFSSCGNKLRQNIDNKSSPKYSYTTTNNPNSAT